MSDGLASRGYYNDPAPVGVDVTPPTITVDSPPEGEIDPDPLVAAVVPLVVRVADAGSAIAYVNIHAVINGAAPELVFRGDPLNAGAGGFEVGFAASDVALDGDEYVFTVRRVGGWPVGNISLTVDAVDSSGNVVPVP